jgi:hypothetical protein
MDSTAHLSAPFQSAAEAPPSLSLEAMLVSAQSYDQESTQLLLSRLQMQAQARFGTHFGYTPEGIESRSSKEHDTSDNEEAVSLDACDEGEEAASEATTEPPKIPQEVSTAPFLATKAASKKPTFPANTPVSSQYKSKQTPSAVKQTKALATSPSRQSVDGHTQAGIVSSHPPTRMIPLCSTVH